MEPGIGGRQVGRLRNLFRRPARPDEAPVAHVQAPLNAPLTGTFADHLGCSWSDRNEPVSGNSIDYNHPFINQVSELFMICDADDLDECHVRQEWTTMGSMVFRYPAHGNKPEIFNRSRLMLQESSALGKLKLGVGVTYQDSTVSYTPGSANTNIDTECADSTSRATTPPTKTKEFACPTSPSCPYTAIHYTYPVTNRNLRGAF